ncbi:MAG: prenyltransferase, partial [Spirochaetia bacterium]|nr:prenyltransferase [Spirochaetia bacterium]
MRWKIWAIEVRAPFLVLPLVLSILGTSLSVFQGFPFHGLNFFAFTVILLLLHITVNTLNEYYDHILGIDYHTQKTMFNGGSGLLQEGAIKPNETFVVAMACFVIALTLCVYLLFDVGILLLPIFLLGMVFALFYTQLFARNMLGELTAGLGLG